MGQITDASDPLELLEHTIHYYKQSLKIRKQLFSSHPLNMPLKQKIKLLTERHKNYQNVMKLMEQGNYQEARGIVESQCDKTRSDFTHWITLLGTINLKEGNIPLAHDRLALAFTLFQDQEKQLPFSMHHIICLQSLALANLKKIPPDLAAAQECFAAIPATPTDKELSADTLHVKAQIELAAILAGNLDLNSPPTESQSNVSSRGSCDSSAVGRVPEGIKSGPNSTKETPLTSSDSASSAPAGIAVELAKKNINTALNSCRNAIKQYCTLFNTMDHPKIGECYYTLGKIEEAQGNLEDAYNCYKTCNIIFPNNPLKPLIEHEALFLEAHLKYNKKNYDEAEKLCQRAWDYFIQLDLLYEHPRRVDCSKLSLKIQAARKAPSP